MLPVYLRRMSRRGGYRAHFKHRLGAHPRLPAPSAGRPRVWVQAVSVGEMLAIAPLLEALKADGVEVYLTTTTSTGYRLAQDRYRGLTSGIGYFPIDWAPFSARAWRTIAPDLVILTEGERWPEHLEQASRRGVPVLSVNARLSDRSYRRLKAFSPAARLILRGVTRILAASPQDEQRFLELGARRDVVTMTGNIKLDVRIPPLAPSEREQLRSELGLPPGLLLLGSSTWPGEEAALLQAWFATRERGLPCSLLLVPRHAERRLDIEEILRDAGVRYHLRTRGRPKGTVDVAVADTTGELRKLTHLADVVFVGKSLPPHTEGQTPVEAAALGKPILFGPGMGNFRAIARDLVARGAAIEVADPNGLIVQAQALLRDESIRARLATAAVAWHRDNSGAMDRTVQAIRDELAKLRR